MMAELKGAGPGRSGCTGPHREGQVQRTDPYHKGRQALFLNLSIVVSNEWRGPMNACGMARLRSL